MDFIILSIIILKYIIIGVLFWKVADYLGSKLKLYEKIVKAFQYIKEYILKIRCRRPDL